MEDELCESFMSLGSQVEPHSTNTESHELTSNRENQENVQPKSSSRDVNMNIIAPQKDLIIQPLNVSEQDSVETVIRTILKRLNEPKSHIIKKCVRVLGKKKSIELLKETEEIIKNGGRMTKQGERKRTPGGIYFQLIDNDASISDEQRTEIYWVEMQTKKMLKSKKRYLKRQAAKNQQQNGASND